MSYKNLIEEIKQLMKEKDYLGAAILKDLLASGKNDVTATEFIKAIDTLGVNKAKLIHIVKTDPECCNHQQRLDFEEYMEFFDDDVQLRGDLILALQKYAQEEWPKDWLDKLNSVCSCMA